MLHLQRFSVVMITLTAGSVSLTDVNAQAATRYGYPVVQHTIDTGGFMGPVNVQHAPWGYNFTLESWMLMVADPEDDIRSEAGMWAYVMNKEAPPPVQMASEVSQHGITWTFDAEYPVGQFVNGDWWVVGPVTIVQVTPGPSVAPPDEENDLGPNVWGDTGLQDNTTLRNGSMVVMAPGSTQGYDSRGRTYSASATINFPYELGANRSLISSISHKKIPSRVVFEAMMWASEKDSLTVMESAAVLTCLPEVPPQDAFRPTYIGGNKTIYSAADLQWDRLMNLPSPVSILPAQWGVYERYLERPWLDHLNGAWQGQWLLPNQNQPAYGREVVRITGIASLLMHLDVPQERKRKLLISLVQYGIDLKGVIDLGGYWNSGGGHTSGRKWPVIFAGLMLGEESFLDMPETAIFHEDVQTYYGNAGTAYEPAWYGQTALWQMVEHHGVREPYMHKHPSTWHSWDNSSESYRRCCNIRAWVGQALAALLMETKRTWDHDAFFDNVEEWMRPEDLYAAHRGSYPRHADETTTFDPFVTAMWQWYREEVPEQPYGDTHRMWDSSAKKWIPNQRP